MNISKPTFSIKPYILNAILEWCEDNHLTPILVSVYHPMRKIPSCVPFKDELFFNVGSKAISNKIISTESFNFDAYIRSLSNMHEISLPLNSITQIKIKETEQVFNLDFKEECENGSIQWPQGIDLTKPYLAKNKTLSQSKSQSNIVHKKPNLSLVWSQDKPFEKMKVLEEEDR